MANFNGGTASNGVKLDADQQVKVKTLLEMYCLNMEDANVEIDKDGEFCIWGYDWLNIGAVPKRDDLTPDEDENMVEEFFEELSHILHKGQQFIVQCVGNEKCCFPLAAMQIVVTSDGVKITGFDPEQIDA